MKLCRLEANGDEIETLTVVGWVIKIRNNRDAMTIEFEESTLRWERKRHDLSVFGEARLSLSVIEKKSIRSNKQKALIGDSVNQTEKLLEAWGGLGIFMEAFVRVKGAVKYKYGNLLSRVE